MIPFINDIINYLNIFDEFDIDDVEKFSDYLKKLKSKIKKLNLLENDFEKINNIIDELIDFNNDLLMTIIMNNL